MKKKYVKIIKHLKITIQKTEQEKALKMESVFRFSKICIQSMFLIWKNDFQKCVNDGSSFASEK